MEAEKLTDEIVGRITAEDRKNWAYKVSYWRHMENVNTMRQQVGGIESRYSPLTANPLTVEVVIPY